MPLRVRHGSTELVLPGKEALASLYRQRRLAPSDLVWHPVRRRWVRVDAFLFIEQGSGGGNGPGANPFGRPGGNGSGLPRHGDESAPPEPGSHPSD